MNTHHSNTNDFTLTAADIEDVARGLRIANGYLVSDIEANCSAVRLEGQRWWDTRPMLDPREHAPQVVDMAEEALGYALRIGLVAQHPTLPHLVRFPPTPAAPAQGEPIFPAWLG